MKLFVILSGSSLIYFSFRILDQGFCNAAASLRRDPHRKLKYAHFKEHFHHILDVPKVEGAVVQSRNHCLLRCMKNLQCLSTNIAAFHRPDGNVSCDLLPTDKYSAAEKFRANHSFHHYSIVSPCDSFPCLNGGTCQALYETDEYTCICGKNFTGKNCEDRVYQNWKELSENSSSESNKGYFFRLGSVVLPVYCHMTDDLGECGAGGWMLVMKINGAKPTFHYDSSLWSNNETFNLDGGETGFDTQETKLPTYWTTPFSKICLGMKIDQQTKFIAINKQASSLYSLIADGNYRATSLGRNAWKKLVGSQASLQRHCNKEGFNVASTYLYLSKARIGILGNDQDVCNTCDSRIGFGTEGSPDDSNTCGNVASYLTDNGDKRIKAIGYILIQ